MTLDEAIERYTSNAEYERTHGNLQGYLDFRQLAEWLKDYKRLLEHELCEDCISRQYLLDNCVVDKVTFPYVPINRIQEAPPVNPQEPKTEQFAKWVAREIFDEENWEYNKDAFAEIACRKLAKLGIVRAKGDEWELIEPQERNGEE